MSAKVFENFNPNDPRTKGEQYLLDVFSSSPRFDGWMIFEQPHINSMKADFVLLHHFVARITPSSVSGVGIATFTFLPLFTYIISLIKYL